MDRLFHAGEQQMHERLGLRELLAGQGARMIRATMPDQHRDFFARLPTMWLGTLDAEGQPWATLLSAAPGFAHSPDAGQLHLDTRPAADDPAAEGLRPGAAVALLGLEPHTRRRNRMNGTVEALDEGGFSVRVGQSFGNCPKYIQARRAEGVRRDPGPVQALDAALTDEALALVRASDTLFIASSSSARPAGTGPDGAGVDISHRGGRPGFVAVRRETRGDRFILPDYAGNRLFNTLGNLLAWPRAGLLFIDWERGDLLQLAAEAEIQHDGPALAEFPGAQRLVHLRLLGGRWRPAALPLRWSEAEPAPQFLGD